MASVSVPWGLNHYYSVLDEKVTVRVLGTVNATTGVELVSAAPTRGLPAVDSPTLLFCALSAYLCAVCGGSLWIRVAGLKPRSREPLLLKMLVFLHNSFCLGLSVYMCAGIVTESFRLKYSVWGNAYKDDETKLAFFIYLFYISKIFELMDTFGLNMVQAYYCIKTQAPYPRFLCKTLFYYMISLVLLFSNFYMHKYSKSSNFYMHKYSKPSPTKQGKLE